MKTIPLTQALSLAGIAGAALWAGLDLPRVFHPMGSDWAQYFTVAEILWHDDPHLYPPFRKPFFGMVLGLIGEHLGYLSAAQWIGRASAVAIVASAGLGAWALVGPLAGLAAAIIATMMPLVMDGALWVNNYPMLGACSGVAVAAGAACARWPSTRWAVLAGIGAGAAHALDVRGLVTIPVVLSLAAVGMSQLRGRKLTGAVLGILTPILLLHQYDQWLTDTHNIEQFTLEGQMQVQRQTVMEPIARGQYVQTPQLQAACVPQHPGAPPPRPWTEVLEVWNEGSCAAALRAYSYTTLKAERTLPDPTSLLLLPLTLLPMAWRRRDSTSPGALRSSIASMIVFGVPTATTLVGLSWVFYFDRYLMASAAVLAMLLPVALGRLFGLLAHKVQPLRWAAPACALIWAATMWPGSDARSLQAPETVRNADYAAGVMARWAQETVTDGDRIFDCGGLALDYLLLPRRIAYVRHPPSSKSCEALILQPGTSSGRTYLITPVLSGRTDLAAQPRRLQAEGWRQSPMPANISDYRLWVR